jgi:hypothetical protein
MGVLPAFPLRAAAIDRAAKCKTGENSTISSSKYGGSMFRKPRTLASRSSRLSRAAILRRAWRCLVRIPCVEETS